MRDPHRARVAFAWILGLCIVGLSAAMLHLAIGGPPSHWLAAGAGLVFGILFAVLMIRLGNSKWDSPRLGRTVLLVGIAAVTFAVPFVETASAVVQIAVLAVADGYLIAVGIAARRRVAAERAGTLT